MKTRTKGVIELIDEVYCIISAGAKRADLESGEGIKIVAYWVGSVIRIDIKGQEK